MGAAAVALRGAGRLVEQAEWAQLILDEMEACGGGADAEAFVLAARSCALAAEYDAAAEVLRRASEAGAPPPLDELEWLVAASSAAAAAATTAAEAKTAYDKLLGELVVVPLLAVARWLLLGRDLRAVRARDDVGLRRAVGGGGAADPR